MPSKAIRKEPAIDQIAIGNIVYEPVGCGPFGGVEVKTRESVNLTHIPVDVLRWLSQAFSVGLKKHGHWGTDKGKEYYLGALERHLKKWKDGEMVDGEDGQHHGAAIIIRVIQAMENERMTGV